MYRLLCDCVCSDIYTLLSGRELPLLSDTEVGAVDKSKASTQEENRRSCMCCFFLTAGLFLQEVKENVTIINNTDRTADCDVPLQGAYAVHYVMLKVCM